MSSIRTSPGLELFGFDNPPEIDLIENFNANFTSGCHVELPEGIDPSAIKYIEAYSVISQEDAYKTTQLFVEYFNKFNVEMNSTI